MNANTFPSTFLFSSAPPPYNTKNKKELASHRIHTVMQTIQADNKIFHSGQTLYDTTVKEGYAGNSELAEIAGSVVILSVYN